MATINATTNQDIQGDGSVQLIRFQSLTQTGSDATAPIEWCQYSDRCVQVQGTWGAAGALVIEGSNDGTNYVTLNSAQGAALSLSADGLKQVLEVPRYARARVTGGDGTTSLNVTFVMRRNNPMRQ